MMDDQFNLKGYHMISNSKKFNFEQFSKLKSIKLENEWEPIVRTKSTGAARGITDNVFGRISKQESGTYKLTLGIGVHVIELLNWENPTTIIPMRSKNNPTLLKLVEDKKGYKLTASNNRSAAKHYVAFTLTNSKRDDYKINSTEDLSFDISEEGWIVIDIEPLLKSTNGK